MLHRTPMYNAKTLSNNSNIQHWTTSLNVPSLTIKNYFKLRELSLLRCLPIYHLIELTRAKTHWTIADGSFPKFWNAWPHRLPRLCGNSLDLEFIRKFLKINKVRPTFHFLTKMELKMTHLVFELYYDKRHSSTQTPWVLPGLPLSSCLVLMKNVKYKWCLCKSCIL